MTQRRMTAMELDRDWLRPADAARLLGVHVSRVYELAKKRALDTIRVDGYYVRVSRADVEARLEGKRIVTPYDGPRRRSSRKTGDMPEG